MNDDDNRIRSIIEMYNGENDDDIKCDICKIKSFIIYHDNSVYTLAKSFGFIKRVDQEDILELWIHKSFKQSLNDDVFINFNITDNERLLVNKFIQNGCDSAWDIIKYIYHVTYEHVMLDSDVGITCVVCKHENFAKNVLLNRCSKYTLVKNPITMQKCRHYYPIVCNTCVSRVYNNFVKK